MNQNEDTNFFLRNAVIGFVIISLILFITIIYQCYCISELSENTNKDLIRIKECLHITEDFNDLND